MPAGKVTVSVKVILAAPVVLLSVLAICVPGGIITPYVLEVIVYPTYHGESDFDTFIAIVSTKAVYVAAAPA